MNNDLNQDIAGEEPIGKALKTNEPNILTNKSMEDDETEEYEYDGFVK